MSENLQNLWTPFKIVAAYFFFGLVWIFLSDTLLTRFVTDPQTFQPIHTYKDWLFVLITAGFLYALIKRGAVRQKQIEKAHLEVGRKYSELVENARDPIYTVGLKGDFRSINKAGEEVLGYRREELLTLNLTDIVEDEDQKYLALIFDDPQLIESFPSIEIRVRRKDGRSVVLEVKNKLVKEPGEDVLIQGIARDITRRKLDEEQLKERESQLRELVTTANEGIWTVDEQGVITFVNNKLAGMLGYEVSEMLGSSMLEYTDEEDKIQAERNLKRRRSGISEQIEFKLKKRDGSPVWVFASTNPIFRKGDFVGALAMMNDITDRRRAEAEKAALAAEIERQRKHLKQIVSSIPGVVWETRTDASTADGNGGFVSEYVEKMLGYSMDEWLQKPDFWLEIIHADDREETRKKYADLIQNREISESSLNYRWLTKRGRVVYIESRMKIERDENGNAFNLLGMAIDITEQQLARDVLRASEERFRSLVNATTQIVWTANADGRMLTAIDSNGAKVDSSMDEVRRSWISRIHPDDRDRAVAEFEKALEERREYYDEYRLLHLKKGTYLHFTSRLIPIRGKDGKIREWVGALTDITRQKEAEKASRENEDRFHALARNASFFWTANAEGKVERLSLNFSDAPQIETAEISSDYFWWLNYVHPDEREATANRWKECLHTKQTCDIESRLRINDGSYRHFYLRSVPVFNADETIREWVGIGIDISLRKDIEQKLIEKERNLEFALKAGKLGTWYVNLEDKSMAYSAGSLEVLGLAPDEELSYERLEQLIHPEDHAYHRQTFINAVKTGEEFHCVHRVITPAGEMRWVDAHGEVLIGEDGRAISISGTAQNITESKLAQEAVRESKNRLDTVIENLNEGLIISDLNGDLLSWNRASLEMHGLQNKTNYLRSLESFADIFEFQTPDGKVLPFEEWVMVRVIRGEVLQNVELKLRRKDIDWEKTFSYSGAKVVGITGHEIAFLSVTDITDKKHAEAELKQLNEELERRVVEQTAEVRDSEERLRLVGENGTDGYWDLNLMTGEEYLSPNLKAVFGYTEDELPNDGSAWRKIIFPEDLEKSEYALREHLEQHKPYNLQVRFQHKNGSTVWVNRRGAALKNEKNEFVRMVGTHINITQQKLAEHALYKLNSNLEQRVLEKTKEVRQSEAFFRQLSEGLPLLVWTCRGEDGSCDYLSPQWVAYTGIAESAQLGFKWLEQIHPDDREDTQKSWLEQAAIGESFVMEFRIRRFDGVYRWFQTRALPLKDSAGKVVKWFGTNVDIDDLKYNEQTMRFLQNLSVQISQAADLEAALDRVLAEVRALTGWDIGEVWLPDEKENVLNLAQTSSVRNDRTEAFLTESRRFRFAHGEGLPGVVWKTKHRLWVNDVTKDERFLRKDAAIRAGIKTGIIIPILMRESVVAVMAFFSMKQQSEDERRVRVVTTVAAQLGEFLQRKRAENELKQSEARLQLGISVGKMGVIEVNIENDVVSFSPEACELFGLPPEKNKISRAEMRAIIHPDDQERVFALFDKSLDPGGSGLFETQHRIIRADGRIRWINVRQQTFFAADKKGNTTARKSVLVFLDYTKTRRMEEDLRGSEDRLKQLHGIVSDFNLSYKEKISKILKLGTKVFGLENAILGEVKDGVYRAAQVYSPGKTFDEQYSVAIEGTICAETLSRNEAFLIEDLSKAPWHSQPVYENYGMHSYFGVSVKTNSRVYGTLSFMSGKARKEAFSAGERQFLKLMAQWIGAELTRNEAEVALRESEERFRILFEQSPVGNVIIDLENNKYLDCNGIASEIFGYSKEELNELTIADLEAAKSAAESDSISQVVRAGGKIQYQTVNRTKSGVLKDLLVVSTGIKIDGRAYSYSSFLDITEMKRAEMQLKRERERVEKVAAVSPGVIYSFSISKDGVTAFPFASAAIYELFGIPPQELQQDGRTAWRLTHPDDRQAMVDSITESMKTMQPWHQIWRVQNPNKGEVWVEGNSAPVKEADGSVTWHGVLTDVTERTRQANELAERERLIRAIFNTAPSLIVLWDMTTGTITYINEAVVHILGISPEEMMNLPKEKLFGRVHPDDLVNVRSFIERLLQARDGEVLSHEYRYQNASGEWVVLHSQDTIFERDENGNVIKTLNIMDDITERKVAEKALRESEERFVKAFEANPAAVAFTRVSDSVIIDVNKSFERMFGFSSDEVIGKTAADIDILIDSLTAKEVARYIRKKRNVQNLEVGMKTKAGEQIYTLLSNELIELNGEECLLSIIYDITDRKRAEEELRKTEEKLLQAQKLESVGRLAGGIAHDFNNMLTAINGYSDLTLRQIGDKSPLRHNLEEIRKAGQRSAELTQQLLAFSRKQVLKPEIINLNSVVNDTSALLKRLIGEDIVLETILRPDIHPVKVDPGHLSQVIVNLAVNSRDAMPQGGILTIETCNVFLDEYYAEFVVGAKAGRYVMLTVSDTGIGMTEEQKEHIFEPFYTTKEVGKGTGLGLATVYGFVKQSEGYIWVYSEPGNGTSFKIYLPAIIDDIRKNMETINNVTLKTGSETILLVEDEELVRNLNREILESYGYKVIEARNGVEALKICSEGEIIIDLLMTDVVMPEMGGSELASRLAATHPELKVLFTSGYTDDSILRHGVTDDSANFLQKPFSLDTLLSKIREVLEK